MKSKVKVSPKSESLKSKVTDANERGLAGFRLWTLDFGLLLTLDFGLVKKQEWQARTKRDLMIEVWERLD
ncbi:MAG TPA: hypothetical protein VNA19_06335, partial [Pyrinomonadaceae bacterium]|nr:hypothetical protein [Pyrinomonadaceae bacterium]